MQTSELKSDLSDKEERESIVYSYVTVHSIAANSNASRHLESSATMGEMHSGQNVNPQS